MKSLMTMFVASTLLLGGASLAANNDSSGAGTVAETMNVGAYVYLRLEQGDAWLAAPPTQLAVGNQVEYSGGMPMKDFYSRALDRTFGSILFVARLDVVQTDGSMHAETQTSESYPFEPSEVAATPAPGEIARLEGGKTIAEIEAASEELIGQQVYLRARVMKVSLDIMGKNWITLQDGTGAESASRLIATSSEVAGVGDLVTVTGVVRQDVDLGYGYNYKLLLEDAAFTP